MVSSEIIIETPGSHVPKTRVLLAKMTVVIIPLRWFSSLAIDGERVTYIHIRIPMDTARW